MRNRLLYSGRLLAFVLSLVLLLSMTEVSQSDETTASFEQAVPYGVAHSEDGSDIPVFNEPSESGESSILHDLQICAVVSAEKLSGNTWYRINYFDDNGIEASGYVSGNAFYQFTVAGLVALMSNPAAVADLQRFSGLALSSAFVPSGEREPRSDSAAETAPPAVDVTPRAERYVLNTHSKKFHKPTCDSVDAIKPENMDWFTGTREELISRGYKPCGRCLP